MVDVVMSRWDRDNISYNNMNNGKKRFSHTFIDNDNNVIIGKRYFFS